MNIELPAVATIELSVQRIAGVSFLYSVPATVDVALPALATISLDMLAWVPGDPVPDHEHEIADVTGLSSALSAAADAITALQGQIDDLAIADIDGLVSALNGLSNAIANTNTRIDDLTIADIAGLSDALTALNDAISGISLDWSAIENKPDTFPPSSHDHSIADVTGLQDALDALADAIGTIPGETNLGVTLSATDVTITSDTGDDAAIPAADTENAGVMLPSHVAQLAGLDAALASARCWAASHG